MVEKKARKSVKANMLSRRKSAKNHPLVPKGALAEHKTAEKHHKKMYK